MRNSDSSKWLTGCAVGCAALLLVVIVVGFGLVFYGRRAVRQVKEITQAEARLERRLGSVKDFCPEPDGRIKPERVLAFIAVDATAEVRGELGQVVAELESAENRCQGGSGLWKESKRSEPV